MRAEKARSVGASVGTCLPLIAEYLAGVSASATAKRNLPLARRTVRTLKQWPFDMAAAEEYARLYAELKKKGIKTQAIDLMAAAIAKLLPDCTVVSTDSDFSRVPGLPVENWEDPQDSP